MNIAQPTIARRNHFRRALQTIVTTGVAAAVIAGLSAGPVPYETPALAADEIVCGDEDGQSQRATTYDAPCLEPESTDAVTAADPGAVDIPVEEEDPAPVEGTDPAAAATMGTETLTMEVAPAETDAKSVQAGELPVWISATGEATEQTTDEPTDNATATASESAAAPAKKALAKTKVAVDVVAGKRAKEARKAAGTWGPVVHLTAEDSASVTSESGERSRSDATVSGIEVAIDVSEYVGKNAPAGGGWENRLRLVAYPACVLETPKAKKCQQGVWLETSRDTKGRLVATVPAETSEDDTDESAGGKTTDAVALASAADAVVMTVSEPSGDGGDWKASSLGPASTWSAGGSAGSFTWSYPLRTPPVASGMAPTLALSYDSGSVDGVIGSSNVQASWAGLGWDLPAGFLERTYVPCADDRGDFESKSANNAGRQTGDQCWRGEVLNLSGGAHAGELVSVGAGKFKLRNDDGSTITRRGVKGGANEHFQLTTTDGTTYVFGQVADGEGPGASWRMPVYGNHAGEPGHDTNFAASSSEVVWRWNLWQVIDPRGNTMTYHWATERNRYRANTNTGAVPEEERGGTPAGYDRGGYLTKITYGTRTGSTGASAARVIFDVAERCRGSYDCSEATGAALSGANANQWPDVPFDLVCANGADCKSETQSWPSFFSTKRLARVRTETNTGTAGAPNFVPVDEYGLNHGFPKKQDPRDEVTLWLSKITHRSGHATPGQGALAGSVSLGATHLNNRVDPGTTAGPPMYRPRVDTIVDELGALTGITYSGHGCVIDGVYPDPANNHRRCFPSEAAYDSLPESKHWFHKYVATQVSQDPGIGATVRTTYTYGDEGGNDGAWAKSDDPSVLDRKRRWTQWRGYAEVTTRVGDPDADPTGHPRTRTVTTYHRGLGPGGQGLDPDARPLAGRVLKVDTYAGANLVKSVATDYTVKLWSPVAADGNRVPRRVDVSKTATTTPRATADGGGTQHVDVAIGYDGAGREVKRNDYAYTKTSASAGPVTLDRTCLYTTYPRDLAAPAEGLTSYPSQSRLANGACAAAPPSAADLLEGTQWAYDGLSVGAEPTKGLVTASKTLDHTGENGSGPIGWVTTGTSTYDAYGRVEKVTDADGNATTTSYAPSDGRSATTVTSTSADPDGSGPLTAHETSTINDPKWALPTESVAPSGAVTTADYDSQGRLASVTMPGNTTGTPDLAYAYQVRGTGSKVNAITTKTLTGTASDPEQLTSVSIFDSLGRPVQTQGETRWTNADNTVAKGRVISVTGYDSVGRVSDVDNQILAGGIPTATFVQSQTAAPEHVTTTYDGASRPLTQKTTWGGTTQSPVTRYAYDGNLTHTTPPDGAVATTTVTDARGRTAQTWRHTDGTPASDASDATKVVTRYAYTPTGLLKTVKDEKNNTWEYDYDQRGRRIATSDPDAGDSTTVYDQLGRVYQATDGNGDTLTSTYDDLSRQTGLYETNSDGSRGDQISGWGYDTLKKGLPTTSTKYKDNEPVHVAKVNAYDAAGRPTSTQTELRATEGLIPAGLAGTYKANQAYRGDGLPTSTSYFPVVSGGTQVLAAEKLTTEYDSLGREIRLGGSMGQYVVGTAWSAYGQIDQLALGNTYGTISWQSYKYQIGSGRMTEAQYDRQTRPELDQQLTYIYDTAGNTKSVRTDRQANGGDDTLWQETECFNYDGLARLKTAWSSNSQICGVTMPASGDLPAGHGYATSFEFEDATFNRTSQVYRTNAGEATATYTYPTSATAGPVHAPSTVSVSSTGTADPAVAGIAGAYSYSPAGQMLTRPTPATGDSTDQALAWDVEHHLAGIDGPDAAEGGDQSGFYDTTGARVIRKVTTGSGEEAKTVTTAYLPGGLELVHDTSKSAVDARRTYVFAGRTVATRTGNDPADVTTWGMDSQGTPEYGIANAEDATATGMVETSPQRRNRPFGGDRGVLPEEKDFPGDIGFVGSTRDEDAGILHVGARPYDPYLGIFLTVDPIVDPASPGSLNAYNYANQNPITFSDPTGLIVWDGERERPDVTHTFGPVGGSTPPPPNSSTNESGGTGGTGEDVGPDGYDEGWIPDMGSQPENLYQQINQVVLNCVTKFLTCQEHVGLQVMEDADSAEEAEARLPLFVLIYYGLWPTLGSPAVGTSGGLKSIERLMKIGKAEKAAKGAGAVLGDTSKLSGWIPSSIPKNAQDAIDDIAKYGVDGTQGRAGTSGFAGPLVPGNFENSGRRGGHILPRKTGTGDPITYRKWGVWQSLDNPNPGGERIVTGSDGSVYYTPTHYQTYIVAVPGR